MDSYRSGSPGVPGVGFSLGPDLGSYRSGSPGVGFSLGPDLGSYRSGSGSPGV